MRRAAATHQAVERERAEAGDDGGRDERGLEGQAARL